jgi:uncharacterized protein
MKLHLANTGQQNVVTGHGDGYIQINGVRHESSVSVNAKAIAPWPLANIRELTPELLAGVVKEQPEIVIIGSGRQFRFPPPAALRPLIEAGIGHEVMDTAAACRTYNVLLGEGRGVMAVMVID